jgi:hypothetical protein
MKKELSKYRLETAKKRLDTAKILLEAGKYEDSVSKSYYAIFSATRALLATKSLDSAKHSGVISLFNQHFVKSGVVKKTMGRILIDAKDARERSDYDDFVIVSREEAEEQLQLAKEFVDEIENVLKEILKETDE